jgi:succinoglycan biosynthesis transport protein ExoP
MSNLIPSENIDSNLERFELYPPRDEFGYPIDPPRHLRENLKILLYRKWVILTCVLTFLAMAAVYTFRQTPIYEATAKVEIDLQSDNVLPYQDINRDNTNPYGYQEYLETQIKHITSRSLARRIVLATGMDRELPDCMKPDENAFRMDSIWNWIPGFGTEEKSSLPVTREERIEYAIDLILEDLEITPSRNSRVVDISYRSPDPKLAANIVNTLTREYIDYNFQVRFDATSRATEFLQRQLVDLKAKVEESESSLIAYARKHNILNVGEKQDVVMQTLEDINSDLSEARATRIIKESIYKTMADATTDKFPQALRTPVMEQLEPRLLADEQELAQISVELGPSMPQVQKLETRVRQARAQLEREKQLAIENARTEYETALASEQLLLKEFDKQKVLANKLNESSIQYNILRREVDTNKQLYDGLLQRMKEAGVAAGLKSSNVRVVDKARVPKIPSSPKPKRNFALSLILGLMGGVGLAFMLNYMDNTVKTPEDVEERVGLPSLGLIPSLKAARGLSGRLHGPRRQSKALPEALIKQGVELATLNAGSSRIAEAIRGLRTSLLLSIPGKPPRSILVTSSKAGEGKTTMVCNTALSLAQTGKKVLVLECDMRRPRIREIFQENGNGLSEYLTGQVEFDEVVIESTIPNLFITHAGASPPNPGELLGSQRMQDAVLSAVDTFDFVLIDTPPLMSVTDPLIVAPLTDGVILVTKGGEVSPDILKRAKKNLESLHARILGVVCNNVDITSGGGYQYYYHQYQQYDSYVSD